MDGEIGLMVSMITVLYACVVLLFAGSLLAKKGTHFWATRTLSISAGFTFICSTLLVIYGLLIWLNDGLDFPFFLILFIAYPLVLIGLLIYAIGFLGFCLRWGATGRRRAELLEITTALTAAKEQAQRDAVSSQTPSSERS